MSFQLCFTLKIYCGFWLLFYLVIIYLVIFSNYLQGLKDCLGVSWFGQRCLGLGQVTFCCYVPYFSVSYHDINQKLHHCSACQDGSLKLRESLFHEEGSSMGKEWFKRRLRLCCCYCQQQYQQKHFMAKIKLMKIICHIIQYFAKCLFFDFQH